MIQVETSVMRGTGPISSVQWLELVPVFGSIYSPPRANQEKGATDRKISNLLLPILGEYLFNVFFNSFFNYLLSTFTNFTI